MVSATTRSLPWVPAITSIVFTITTHSLLLQYGRLHWPVLSRHWAELADPVRQDLVGILGWLHIYRLGTAALAFGFAIWALFAKPRWVGAIALAISLFAVFEAMIIM